MAESRTFTLTPYSSLAHKALMRGQRGHLPVAPTWLPESEQLRIDAYYLRQAYLSNAARNLLVDVDEPDRLDHREYGDADLIVGRFVSAVLGDGWRVQIVGADQDLPDVPDLPAHPGDAPTGDNVTDIDRRIYQLRLDRWTADANAGVDVWADALEARPGLQARQAEIDAWVDTEGVRALVDEVEHDIAGLGDGVVVLWPQRGDWPRLEVMDPAAYFPVTSDFDDGRYPRKIHLCWEYDITEPLPSGGVRTTTRLRRITFELVDLLETRIVDDGAGGVAWMGADGEPADRPVLYGNETIGADRLIRRLYPWDQGDGDGPAEGRQPSRDVCIYSDGTWATDDIGHDMDALDPSKAVWTAWRVDLGVDFIPVVHLPNTTTGKHPFGRSVIDPVVQVLDDLADSDTSAMSASRFLREPIIHAPGITATDLVRPGMLLGGPDGSRMDVLDLSAGLAQLRAQRDDLLDRTTVNARIPAEILGRADATDLSGIALALRFAPFAQVIGSMRMVRDPKWSLVWKMAQRMAQVQRRPSPTGEPGRGDPVLPPGPTPSARMGWGSFLPTDQSATIDMVAAALGAHVMSLQTAVAMLVAAGVPVDDARAEVDRIVAEDIESANVLADALAGAPGLVELIAERLGIDLPDAPSPQSAPQPVITLPGVPQPSQDDPADT